MPTITLPQVLPPAVDVTSGEEARLLGLARRAVSAACRGQPDAARAAAAVEAAGETGATGACRVGGAFVTLLEDGALRGCIGSLDPSVPLAESVAEAAIGAAIHDWRFRPLTEDELPVVDIEISVLGPFVVLGDPLAFRLGIDGLLVERGFDRGLLLPEVASDHGLDAVAMLEAICRKAGLPGGAWRDPATRVVAFRTKRFGGPAVPTALRP
jgi:AmmeMemoRadiSam system protein A